MWTLSWFFRHRRPDGSSTCHVPRGLTNRAHQKINKKRTSSDTGTEQQPIPPNQKAGKPMGKSTGGRPCDKPRGMILSSLEKNTKVQNPPKETSNHRATSRQTQKRPNRRQKELTKRRHRQQQPRLHQTRHHRDAPLAKDTQLWQRLLGTASQ